jgi:hypothetical protein
MSDWTCPVLIFYTLLMVLIDRFVPAPRTRSRVERAWRIYRSK